MACPECASWIQPTIENIIFDGGVRCLTCGLHLAVNQQASKETLNQLRRYYDSTASARAMANQHK